MSNVMAHFILSHEHSRGDESGPLYFDGLPASEEEGGWASRWLVVFYFHSVYFLGFFFLGLVSGLVSGWCRFVMLM